MSRVSWIILGLVAVLMISTLYMSDTGQLDRPWMECKESMVVQIFSDQCTPRDGGLRGPAPADTVTDQPPLDDGVTRVDRGQ